MLGNPTDIYLHLHSDSYNYIYTIYIYNSIHYIYNIYIYTTYIYTQHIYIQHNIYIYTIYIYTIYIYIYTQYIYIYTIYIYIQYIYTIYIYNIYIYNIYIYIQYTCRVRSEGRQKACRPTAPIMGPRRSASQRNVLKGAGVPVLFCTKHDCHKQCQDMRTASGSIQDPGRNPRHPQISKLTYFRTLQSYTRKGSKTSFCEWQR